MKKILSIIFFGFFIYSFAYDNNLGEMFDVLMGKYTNQYYSAYMKPTAPPWCYDSYFAYCFSRSLFEKYSIESEWHNEGIKIPKIIHQIWLGGLVPEKYADWMSTWIEHHPDWTYILWTDDDIQYLNLSNRDLFEKASNFGEKSDILRVELINLFGGLYIDTDYECLKPFDKFHYCNSFYISAIPYGGNGYATNNALIAAPPKHPLMRKLVETMKISAKFPDLSNRTGPIYFTRTLVENFDLCPKNMTIYPPCYFTPDPTKARNDIHSYAIHWFDASWGRSHCGEKKIYKDTRIEKSLMPLYLHHSPKLEKFPKILPKLYYDSWYALFAKLKRRTIVELGACNFMIDVRMDLHDLHYVGISPVKFLVLDQRLYYMHHENRTYFWKDILHDELPECGLLIIGNVMEYLPYEECLDLCENLEKCNAEFFIIAHDEKVKNTDTSLGKIRLLNMCEVPFNLPKPHKIITVNKKKYGVWKKPNKEK